MSVNFGKELPKPPSQLLRTISVLFSTISVILSFSLTAPPGATPANAQIQGKTFLVFAPFWKLNEGFSSTLMLRNRHLKSVVSATPILYTAEGTELRLPTLQLPA